MTRMIELEKELKTTKQNTQFEVRKAMRNSNEYLVLNNQKLNIERENDHLQEALLKEKQNSLEKVNKYRKKINSQRQKIYKLMDEMDDILSDKKALTEQYAQLRL